MSKYGLSVAACDKELCGKTLKFKDIEFHVNPAFYKKEEGTKEDIISILREAVNINLVGKESVDCGIECGVIKKENVLMIGDVPHAQAVAIAI